LKDKIKIKNYFTKKSNVEGYLNNEENIKWECENPIENKMKKIWSSISSQ